MNLKKGSVGNEMPLLLGREWEIKQAAWILFCLNALGLVGEESLI